MRFTVNYISDGVLSYTTEKDTCIKYPIGKYGLETLANLANKGYKIVLNGIIP